jgi:hypothetical protein
VSPSACWPWLWHCRPQFSVTPVHTWEP